MSSFLIELLIPVLIVLSLGIFRIRDAWVWSWATWLNDVDYVTWMAHVGNPQFPNLHRALFHNLFLLALVVGFGWRSWTKFRRAGGAGLAAFASTRPGWLLVPFYYTCHLVLDIFAGGVALLWPLTSTSFYWDFVLLVDTTHPVPTPTVETEAGPIPGVVDVSPTYLWMDSEQFAIFVLYLLALGLTMAYERLNGRPAFAWFDRRWAESGPSPPAKEGPIAPEAVRKTKPRQGKARPPPRKRTGPS